MNHRQSGAGSAGFPTIFGYHLIAELPNFVHRPYLIVTMEDLWPAFRDLFPMQDPDQVAGVHFVTTLDITRLDEQLAALPQANAVIGLGGGQALDVAKHFSWRRRLPLFQAPTVMSVDAVFGQRAAVREDGHVRYIGWAIPQAVYVDFDVIRSAPPLLNRSGVGDILCFHTAHYDWQLAHRRSKSERQWPFDQALVEEARAVLDGVLENLDDIRAVNDKGIRTLMHALRWGGAAYHNAGWNPRHVEGSEHFFFYTLEYQTGRKFIHGQPVCLGAYICSVLQENRPDFVLDVIRRVGVDIRPQTMGITWEDVGAAMRGMAGYVEQTGLWYTIINERPITPALITQVRDRVEAAFG